MSKEKLDEIRDKVVEMVGVILTGLSVMYNCKIDLDLTNLKITENKSSEVN